MTKADYFDNKHEMKTFSANNTLTKMTTNL